MPQSLIGCLKQDFDTPALCIDLDRLEANTRSMAEACRSRNVAWRPHEKCHKTPAIAHLQQRAGAIGVTCGKVSEAEVMAAGGIRDILVANMVVGERKWERVAALTRWADPIIACDHFAQVEPLAAICQQRGVAPRVIIEVDIGLHRVGAQPGRDTLELAQAISKLKGVKFAGIMGYEGHLLRVEDPAEKKKQIGESIGTLVSCRDQVLKAGLCCDLVSCGGTGSYLVTLDCPGITEIQAGGGIFMDPMYREVCHVDALEYALTVLATVVSRPMKDRAVLDAGRKTFNGDFGAPKLVGSPDAVVTRMSAEHCELQLGPQSQDLKIGDKVEIVVGYGDFTTVLHDEFYGFRKDRLEVIWPILGRGMIQ